MRSHRPTPEHQEAVSRRLALLSAELATARPGPVGGAGQRETVAWWDEHTRLPAARPEVEEPWVELTRVEVPVVQQEESPLVPVPGRHASRRARRAMAAAVPETLRGRVALGPGPVAVVAVLVALGLAVTCWWVVRGDSSEVVAPLAASSAGALVSATDPTATAPASSSAPPTSAGTSADSGGDTVTVDVAGRVKRPGIAVLGAGARVVDALDAAGGARRGVDLTSLNLARLLIDGEQILVGRPAAVGTAASAVPSGGLAPVPGAPVGLVNLNSATQAELEALPQVGPVTALSIIAWRDEHGGFSSVDELLEVDGIGDATLGQLAPFVTV